MVDRGGNIYLTDFGIARHAHSSTTTLGVVGTPAYMAPEQFMNKPVSAPTDIYALGALLYKLLTGRRPYTDMPTGAEASVTPPEGAAYAHLFQPPPNPLEANPGLPPALANVVLTAMAKDPARRYQTTMQLLEAACAAIGVVPNQLPARISLTDLETGTLRVQPMPSGPAGTMRASPAYQATSPAAAPYPQTMPQERIYPETAAVPAAGKGRAGIPPWIWALAGLFIVALLCGGALIFAGLPVLDRLLDTPTSAPTLAPTATSLPPGVPTLPPSQTPLPTFTPLATYTALPTHTPPPPPTEAPPPTQPPPTARPDVSNPLVRIRNRTGYDANLYRIGRTGESHFLGWLVTGFYGEYKFPSLGEWVIRYCHRDPNGDSFNCREKQINVTAEGQEFSVP
jgi:serine/threonine-protein kinase